MGRTLKTQQLNFAQVCVYSCGNGVHKRYIRFVYIGGVDRHALYY